MDHHPRLREREGSDEGGQAIVAAKQSQKRGETYQRNDAVGVKQATPADLEYVPVVVMQRNGAGGDAGSPKLDVFVPKD